MKLKNMLPSWLGGGRTEQKSITLEKLAELMRGREGTAAGVSVTDESAMRLSAVFGCVRVLSLTASYLPWSLLEVKTDGSKHIALRHPVHRLVNLRPNEFQTPAVFKQYMLFCALLKGNFYAFKVRGSDGQVRELLPLPPGSVDVKQNDDWSVEYKVTGRDGRQKVYTSHDVYHYFMLTTNGYTGCSVLKYAKEAVGQGIAMQQYGAALFKNGARPDYVIMLPQGFKGGEALENLKADWNELFMGTSNAGRPGFLEDGMKIETISLNNDDVQFLETKAFTRTEICGFFGVPPHLVGDLTDATFSNIEHQDLSFLKYGLLPWLNQSEESGRLQLLKPAEQVNHEINIDESRLRRGDLDSQTNFIATAVGRPIKTVNEERRDRGMNPVDGGDELAIQPGVGDGKKTQGKTNAD